MVLANGEEPSIISDILEGQEVGTLFTAKRQKGENIMSSLISMGQKAKEASYELGIASAGQRCV